MTPRLEFRAMDRWTGPVVTRSSSARFRVKWTAVRDQLLSECEALGAGLVVVELVINPADIRQDGHLKANAKTLHPGAKVSFESDHGPLSFSTDAYERQWAGDLPGWQANLRAIGLGLAALRAVDRYGITKSGEQFRGFIPLADKPFGRGEMTVDQAIDVLVTTGGPATREELLGGNTTLINAAYRSAARQHHPDAGGNDAVFQQITKARDVLLAAAK
jgi:hypothetical protein